MAKKQLILLIGLILVLSVFLAACTEKENASEGEKGLEKEQVGEKNPVEDDVASSFPLDVANKADAIEDGELTVAIVADEPFKGTLSRIFSSGGSDGQIMTYFDESLLATDGDYMITNQGAATFEISNENKTITLTIRDGVNWHDGEPVKASDLLYAYELLGHPDYVGDHYNFLTSNIEGMHAYNEGKTDNISGIEVFGDDKKISITYTEATPLVLNGVFATPIPRHYLGDMTIKEIMSSEKIRTKPIGFGPYKVAKVVLGESVYLERNDEYWRGKPALGSIVLKVVNNATILESIKKGDVDIAKIPADQYLNAKEIANIELLGEMDTGYSYIGFNLGRWDEVKKENIMDPSKKMSNKLVRQAMFHAMDNETIGKELYNGLRIPATTLIIPKFAGYHDASNPGRPYDPEKAKALLDEAGFVDVDGDGFREDDKGEEYVITFASMSGGETAEPIAKFYMQNWADVGLNVQLLDGRLHDFNVFYDMLKAGDTKIDIYQGAWNVGYDPDPAGIHSRTAAFNYTHFVSDKNDELLAAGVSIKAFDSEFRKKIYNEWQEYMAEEVPLAPTVYRYNIMGVNKRVVNYSLDPSSENFLPWVLGVSE